MLLGFQARFAADVESGKKCQTIRAPRRDGRLPKLGERVYLYTGLRTPKARKLGEGEVESVRTVWIVENGSAGWQRLPVRVWVSGRRLGDARTLGMAVLDGFLAGDRYQTMHAFADFFRRAHGLPFEGHLIRWRLVSRSEWRRPASERRPVDATR